MPTYDLIIIGAGPAGITAAVYAARRRMDFIVLTDDIGGQAAWSGDIENYTGYQFITGPELAARFEEHLQKFDIALHEREPATAIAKEGDEVVVSTARASYRARTVIIASGKRTRELNVPGEREFKNHGLTYCATCDGPLFAGRDVAVIGGGNSALDAVLQMMNIASHVHLININPALNCEAVMREKAQRGANVTIRHNSRVTAITGDTSVKGIRVVGKGGEEETIAVQGVFVEIGLTPNSEFVTLTEKNAYGEIIVNANNETSVPGIFAAGDVTNVPEKQIIIAAGEGSKACLGAARYLAQHSFL